MKISGEQAFSQLVRLVADLLVVDTSSINAQTSAYNQPAWDSLNHIRLVLAVEKKFGIRFTTTQIRTWQSLGDLHSDLCILLDIEN